MYEYMDIGIFYTFFGPFLCEVDCFYLLVYDSILFHLWVVVIDSIKVKGILTITRRNIYIHKSRFR